MKICIVVLLLVSANDYTVHLAYLGPKCHMNRQVGEEMVIIERMILFSYMYSAFLYVIFKIL